MDIALQPVTTISITVAPATPLHHQPPQNTTTSYNPFEQGDSAKFSCSNNLPIIRHSYPEFNRPLLQVKTKRENAVGPLQFIHLVTVTQATATSTTANT